MLFISGRLSLDLAHTGGPGPYKAFERLHTPADLAIWLEISELELVGCAVTQADLNRSYKLRWAIWKAASALRLGQAPEPTDVKIINTIAAIPPLVPVFSTGGGRHVWKQPATAKAALSSVARDAIELFAHNEHMPIQQCQNPNCPLLFVDDSRAQKRKWCAMERCGTIMKVAKHRKK